MTSPTPELRTAIQHNCHISDALHARSYTLCTYLLKMREYYRWEKAYPFSASLPKDEIGLWLEQRERLWEKLESAAFVPLPIGSKEYDPFDSEAVNELLVPQGLVYSSGYGSNLVPHFFLGTLLRADRCGKVSVLVSGQEFARDLAAPPAMTLNDTILVRRESLRRLLWERIDEWQWRRQENPMARAIAHYAFDSDLDAALEEMADNEVGAAILHELGEAQAGEIFGDEWHEMLLVAARSPAEILIRAVRDHLADCLSTLPGLIESNNAASLHFYFANFKGMRLKLFPTLLNAYHHWQESGSLARLSDEIRQGTAIWEETGMELLCLYRRHGEACNTHIDQLMARLPRLADRSRTCAHPVQAA